MTYHIALFTNKSGNNVITANPVAQRDTYFISRGLSQKPDHNVEISKGAWKYYDDAFPHANFIYNGVDAYCFWDSGKSTIYALTKKSTHPDVVYEGKGGVLELTIASNGDLVFIPAS